MKQGSLILILMAFVFAMQNAYPRNIYKWTDEQGNVHYGEKPPEKGATEVRIKERGGVEEIDKPAPDKKQNNNDQRDRMIKALESDRLEREAIKKKKAKQENNQKRKCLRAKDKLYRFQRSNRVYKLDDKGNRVYMPDQYRQKRIDQLMAEVKKWCK